MKYAIFLISIFLISCDYNPTAVSKEKYDGLQSQLNNLQQRVDSLINVVNELKPKPAPKNYKKKKAKKTATNTYKAEVISQNESPSKYNWKAAETEAPSYPVKEKKRTYSVRVGARCCDGSRSYATGRGACSHHGGVCEWLYE